MNGPLLELCCVPLSVGFVGDNKILVQRCLSGDRFHRGN